ncbi:cytochrome c1-like [Lathamus discolor]|uniref:cytochrome c1-like n=1 Tax=Lathamus discolor TaxID=678569 RepID=UPI0032B80869
MACNTVGLRQQGEMDVAVDLYLAVPLLFTVLALVLTSVFVRLQGAEGEQPREPAAAEAARESGPGGQAAVGAGPEAGSKAAAEQREEAAEQPSPAEEPNPAEEPSPAVGPSPAAAESIPRKPPAEPQEDAGVQAAFPSKAEEEDLHSGKEKLVVGEPASTAATPAPLTSTAASLESSEGFEWPLGTLGTCLLIVMGISMLAHTEIVFYPRLFCLISEVKQSQVCFLSGVRAQYGRTKRSSPRLDSHEWQGVWDSMSEYLVHWAPPVL